MCWMEANSPTYTFSQISIVLKRAGIPLFFTKKQIKKAPINTGFRIKFKKKKALWEKSGALSSKTTVLYCKIPFLEFSCKSTDPTTTVCMVALVLSLNRQKNPRRFYYNIRISQTASDQENTPVCSTFAVRHAFPWKFTGNRTRTPQPKDRPHR